MFPYEKGTETKRIATRLAEHQTTNEVFPYEKGTETCKSRKACGGSVAPMKCSPMRRGLKPIHHPFRRRTGRTNEVFPYEKGTETAHLIPHSR